MPRAPQRRAPGFLLLTTVLAVLCTALGGTARAEYPVDYNFFAGIPYELADPGGSLPGSNDWSCRPSAAHPNPVVLLHGTAGGAQTNWGAYVPLLANEGYCVYALNYGALDVPWPLKAMGGMRPVPESAQEVAVFVDRVLAATGAAKVDFIGHSQGSLVGNYFVKRLGGADLVEKFVSIAGPWLGAYGEQMNLWRTIGQRLGVDADTLDAGVSGGICFGCSQIIGGSTFLAALNGDGVYAPNVAYTNIATVYDEIAYPYTSGLVEAPNAVNIVVQDGCPSDFSEHLAIAGSPRAAAYALNALDPAHPRPVPCEFIPPFTG
ncbi:alpha/beta fold hydrolase [Nocardia sp. 2]|uniref:Alpha/beta fold hydrolase n=1 Tax=Nocardia acididurans TaxID=2802282 RepID=A0ABS1M9X4_9NOCA|nr:alpha/beta fold hydrolase [Nocardia acididurans]MBL1077369.1 alpha/beta fold hydrolase [Nocardia acididurans]